LLTRSIDIHYSGLTLEKFSRAAKRHAVYVHPDWVREMKKMGRFGSHNFYRPIAWGNGAEEPSWGNPALMANKKN
jgi:hypothetical protein